jgi:hypothetical protein
MEKEIKKIYEASLKGQTYWEYDPKTNTVSPAIFKHRVYRFLFWKHKKIWLDRKEHCYYIPAVNKENALRKGQQAHAKAMEL